MQVPEAKFDFEQALSQVLSDGKEQPCIFDRLLAKFEAHASRAAGSIYEIKRRDSKKSKGDGWESFCQWYLSRVCGYHYVWMWKEVPAEARAALKLGSKVDNGIDIVAMKLFDNGFQYWTAVQCKYRKELNKTVTWTQLSTFIGLCAQTGPWSEHLVMTNCKGVSRKTGIPKGPKDKTMAYGTFKKLNREMCTRVAPGHNSNAQSVAPETTKKPSTIEELRAARLAKFT